MQSNTMLCIICMYSSLSIDSVHLYLLISIQTVYLSIIWSHSKLTFFSLYYKLTSRCATTHEFIYKYIPHSENQRERERKKRIISIYQLNSIKYRLIDDKDYPVTDSGPTERSQLNCQRMPNQFDKEESVAKNHFTFIQYMIVNWNLSYKFLSITFAAALSILFGSFI